MGIKLTVECDTLEEIIGLVGLRDTARDCLRDRVNQLQQTPLAYSLADVARFVGDDQRKFGLTPDQSQKIVAAIAGYTPNSR